MSRRGQSGTLGLGATIIALVLLLAPGSSGPTHTQEHRTWHTLAQASGATVRGVAPGLKGGATMVVAVITSARPHIERDVGVRLGRLIVDLYPDHASFAAALRRQQHTLAQSDEDNTSAIVHRRLLLGPTSTRYLPHDLVHVYTEWALDHLTGNIGDTLPANPWLYDGIAEYEAYRYVPGRLPCRANMPVPFNVTSLRTPRQWLKMRGGPLVALEYCAAYLKVRGVIERKGWTCVLRTIHRYGWQKAGVFLEREATFPPGCGWKAG